MEQRDVQDDKPISELGYSCNGNLMFDLCDIKHMYKNKEIDVEKYLDSLVDVVQVLVLAQRKFKKLCYFVSKKHEELKNTKALEKLTRWHTKFHLMENNMKFLEKVNEDIATSFKIVCKDIKYSKEFCRKEILILINDQWEGK